MARSPTVVSITNTDAGRYTPSFRDFAARYTGAQRPLGFSANLNNPPRRLRGLPTLVADAGAGRTFAAWSRRDLRAAIALARRIGWNAHPALRVIRTAMDLYDLYRLFQTEHPNPDPVSVESPHPGWQRYSPTPGMFPATPYTALGYTNQGTIYGGIYLSTGQAVRDSNNPLWNNVGYVGGIGYFGRLTQKFAFGTLWYTRRYDQWQATSPGTVTVPSFNAAGDPVTQVSSAPDPAPGYVPVAFQLPGAEPTFVEVPYRSIHHWNRFREAVSPGSAVREYPAPDRDPPPRGGLEITITPGQGARIAPAPQHNFAPPRNGQERKSTLGRSFAPLARFIGETPARRIVRGINMTTEAADWTAAIFYALPEEIRHQYDRPTPQLMAWAIVDNFESLDLGLVARNIAVMQAQDAFLGRLSSAATRRLRSQGGHQNRGFEFFGSHI